MEIIDITNTRIIVVTCRDRITQEIIFNREYLIIGDWYLCISGDEGDSPSLHNEVFKIVWTTMNYINGTNFIYKIGLSPSIYEILGNINSREVLTKGEELPADQIPIRLEYWLEHHNIDSFEELTQATWVVYEDQQDGVALTESAHTLDMAISLIFNLLEGGQYSSLEINGKEMAEVDFSYIVDDLKQGKSISICLPEGLAYNFAIRYPRWLRGMLTGTF